MNTKEKQISIIIPVYNVKSFLHRCIDSIRAQSYLNFECLLVDDGSTDGSGAICDEYAKIDSRFHAIHINNSGPSAARNIGLENVTTSWVTFVDADDYVEPEYLDNFFKYNQNNYSTQVIQGYRTFGYEGEENDTLYPGVKYEYNEVFAGKQSHYLEENGILNNWAVWCKVFSMEIIKQHNIKFEESVWCGEDGAFWHKYLCFINKIIFIPERGYIYYCPRQFNSVSRTQKHLSTQTFIDLAKDYKVIGEVLPKKFYLRKKYSSFLRLTYLNNYFKAWLKSSDLTENQKIQLKKIQPSKFYIVWTQRGIMLWILNLLPINIIRKLYCR